MHTFNVTYQTAARDTASVQIRPSITRTDILSIGLSTGTPRPLNLSLVHRAGGRLDKLHPRSSRSSDFGNTWCIYMRPKADGITTVDCICVSQRRQHCHPRLLCSLAVIFTQNQTHTHSRRVTIKHHNVQNCVLTFYPTL